MPVDDGDDVRWAELPGGFGGSESTSSSDEGDNTKRKGENCIDNVSSLSSDGEKGTLLFPLPLSTSTTLRISHDSTQGLAARVWPSAAMIVDFIAEEIRLQEESNKNDGGGSEIQKPPFSWKGASVLELGCGPGLTGIAIAALAERSRVLLTDLEGPALRLARENVEVNASEIESSNSAVDVAELRWGSEPPFACLPSSSIDVVIAADVIYDAELFEPLLRTLEDLSFGRTGDDDGGGVSKSSSSLRPPPPRILIAHVRRWKRDARFWAAARKRFDVFDVTPRKRGGEGEVGNDDDKSEKRYSSFERGALRVFELVPRVKTK